MEFMLSCKTRFIAADPRARQFTQNGHRQSQERGGGALPAAFLEHLSFSVQELKSSLS